MLIFGDGNQTPAGLSEKGSVVTIGNFDGVHLGHRHLLGELKRWSEKLVVPSVVVTFEPHPMKVLFPQKGHRRLFSLADQKEQIREQGIDVMVVHRFTPEFAALTAQDFLDRHILASLVPRAFVVGYDFAFGSKKSGSLAFLQEYCGPKEIELVIVPPFRVNDGIVSSSEIKSAIDIGKVELAARMLGRNYYVEGQVVRGAGRGRGIGVPTANLACESDVCPARGVYCGWAHWNGRRIPMVVNIGHNPTFQDDTNKKSVEAHLLDFEGDLYGAQLKLEFLRRLREEKKFQNVGELVNQIKSDIAEAKRVMT